MRITTHISAVAFAAADKSAGAAAAAAAPAESPTSDALTAVTDTTKVEAIGKAMRSRKLYPDFESAYAALTKAAGETDNFYGLPIVIVGHDSETDTVDPAVYEGASAALAYVGARIREPGKDKMTSGIKAIVIFPVPTVESFLASEAGAAMVAKVVEKESAHIAFRSYREADTLAELLNGAASAPKSVDDYATASSREASDLDTETFDALWTGLRNTLKETKPKLVALFPPKAEVLKCIRSKSYAESGEKTQPLEEAGVFERLATALINGAAANKTKEGEPAPLDSSAIEAWLAGRDTLNLKRSEAKELDFGVLKSGELDF